MNNMYCHFQNISGSYNELRTTDVEPIRFICQRLRHRSSLKGADIGCGGGRYDLLLLKHLPELRLICGDINEAMIKATACYLEQHGQKTFSTRFMDASDLQLPAGALDFVATFNAIHHFEPVGFLNKACKALKHGGYVFVYTRLKSQNKRGIWGRYFPGFVEKEDRLYDLAQIEKWCRNNEYLALKKIHFFRFKRVLPLGVLLSQAQKNHYSTFSFYTNDEFDQALEKFKQKIETNFADTERIHWHDENVMLVFRKA